MVNLRFVRYPKLPEGGEKDECMPPGRTCLYGEEPQREQASFFHLLAECVALYGPVDVELCAEGRCVHSMVRGRLGANHHNRKRLQVSLFPHLFEEGPCIAHGRCRVYNDEPRYLRFLVRTHFPKQLQCILRICDPLNVQSRAEIS